MFSAGIPRGLIEARRPPAGPPRSSSFPRVFPAASLKQRARQGAGGCPDGFPRVFPAASLKRPVRRRHGGRRAGGFPRVFPAASLKQHGHRDVDRDGAARFSAGIPRGLIEAWLSFEASAIATGFPRVFPAASLKLGNGDVALVLAARFPRVFPAASLKQLHGEIQRPLRDGRFPRVFPAASLKPVCPSPSSTP